MSEHLGLKYMKESFEEVDLIKPWPNFLIEVSLKNIVIIVKSKAKMISFLISKFLHKWFILSNNDLYRKCLI